MLVQRRPDALWLIRQQDHALVAGELAHAWRGTGGGESGGALPFRLVWTTSLHDLAWQPLDAEPHLDPATGLPTAFHDHPLEEKLSAYDRGVDRLAELSPYAGLLVSRHYSSFVAGEPSAEAYRRREEKRQADLRGRLPADLRGSRALDRELAFLKLFDTLSLYLCLASPAAAEARPPWLVPEDRVESPDGEDVALEWVGEGTLLLSPFPFRGAVEARVPYRELPARRYEEIEELRRAWRRAPSRHWTVRVAARA